MHTPILVNDRPIPGGDGGVPIGSLVGFPSGKPDLFTVNNCTYLRTGVLALASNFPRNDALPYQQYDDQAHPILGLEGLGAVVGPGNITYPPLRLSDGWIYWNNEGWFGQQFAAFSDNLQDWVTVNLPFPTAPGHVDMAYMSSSDTLFAYIDGRGYGVSTNRGVTWTEYANSPYSGTIHVIGTTDRVFLSDGTTHLRRTDGVIFDNMDFAHQLRLGIWTGVALLAFGISSGTCHRTTDNGVTWQEILLGGPVVTLGSVIKVACHNSRVILASNDGRNLWVSEDHGNTWGHVQGPDVSGSVLGVLVSNAGFHITWQDSKDISWSKDGTEWFTLPNAPSTKTQQLVVWDGNPIIIECAHWMNWLPYSLVSKLVQIVIEKEYVGVKEAQYVDSPSINFPVYMRIA